MAVPLDADDLQGQQVCLPNDFLRVADATIDELRHVDQAFDWPFDTGERPERDELRNEPGHHLSFLVLVDNGVPLLGLRPSQTEGDLFVFGVDLRNVNVYFVAHLK